MFLCFCSCFLLIFPTIRCFNSFFLSNFSFSSFKLKSLWLLARLLNKKRLAVVPRPLSASGKGLSAAQTKRAVKYHTLETFCAAFVWHLIKWIFFVPSAGFFWATTSHKICAQRARLGPQEVNGNENVRANRRLCKKVLMVDYEIPFAFSCTPRSEKNYKIKMSMWQAKKTEETKGCEGRQRAKMPNF